MTTSVDYFYNISPSPLHFLTIEKKNQIYIKRDDLLPFSLGGNKARKAPYFFKEILQGGYTTVVTYGSKSSNHCRVIANLSAKHHLKCVIISPHSTNSQNYNRKLINLCDASVIECQIEEVPETIKRILNELKHINQHVYFIPGGGHGNFGTQAYIDAYQEIVDWQRENQIDFDYIFLASGTGTTQTGLLLGALSQQQTTKIIGISIARKSDYGTAVIKESVHSFLKEFPLLLPLNVSWENFIYFYDSFIPREYGVFNKQVSETIQEIYVKYGIAFNRTYTGKAYTGMLNYIESMNLIHQKILFIHTGGVPLFFNDLEGN